MAWVVPAIAAVGEAAGTAAGAVGSTIGSAATALGSLFGGEAGAAGAAGAAEAAAPAAAALVPEAAAGFVGPLPEAAAAGVVPEAVTAMAAPAAAATTPPGFLGTIGNAVKAFLPGPSGFGNLAEGIQTMFGGGPESAPGFVGPPSAWAGPEVTGPGFLGGFVQGLTGKYTPASAPSGATAGGAGIGQLVSFLNQMHGSPSQAAPMGPIVRMGQMPTAPFTTLIPQSQPTEVATGPIMKLLAHL